MRSLEKQAQIIVDGAAVVQRLFSLKSVAMCLSGKEKKYADKKSDQTREVSREKTVNPKDDSVWGRETKISRNDHKKNVERLAERPRTAKIKKLSICFQ